MVIIDTYVKILHEMVPTNFDPKTKGNKFWKFYGHLEYLPYKMGFSLKPKFIIFSVSRLLLNLFDFMIVLEHSENYTTPNEPLSNSSLDY